MADHVRDYDWRDSAGTRQDGAGMGEHVISWIMGIGALACGIVGLLVGFGILGSSTSVAGTSVGDAVNQAGGAVNNTGPDWQQGMLWLLPALGLALLALAFHQTDHHFTRGPETDEGRGMFGFEHALTYLFALGAIAGGVIGLLVGFDVFDNGYTPGDGFLWEAASIGLGILSAANHRVRHHQLAEDEAYIVSVVDRRVGPGTTTTTTGRLSEPGAERRP